MKGIKRVSGIDFFLRIEARERQRGCLPYAARNIKDTSTCGSAVRLCTRLVKYAVNRPTDIPRARDPNETVKNFCTADPTLGGGIPMALKTAGSWLKSPNTASGGLAWSDQKASLELFVYSRTQHGVFAGMEITGEENNGYSIIQNRLPKDKRKQIFVSKLTHRTEHGQGCHWVSR